MLSAAGPYQHSSHRGLLKFASNGRRSTPRVDGIIVPSARPAGSVRNAVGLARTLGCPLVVFCSMRSSATEVVELAGDVPVFAVDLTDEDPEPNLETTRILAGTRFEMATDISVKRNFGLALARILGWDAVLFLDDDIEIEDPRRVLAAASIIDTYDMVGLSNLGYPDNSVVCHARREAGWDQETFVGGGALLVPAKRTDSFFPRIYNDDWFFMLGQIRLRSVASVDAMSQQEYDPYETVERARSQEFGDCLAEGVFALLDEAQSVSAADETYWEVFLDGRRRDIDEIIEAVRAPSFARPHLRDRMVAALRAARDCHGEISPRMCVEYLRVWQRDQRSWAEYLDRLPTITEPAKALAWLGLNVVTNGH